MFCQNCGKELKDNVKFCTNCGNKNITSSSFASQSGKCPKCGSEISGKKFCTNCGYKITDSYIKSNAKAVDIKIDDSIDIDTLYKRAFMYLEDGKKDEAYTYFEHFLDKNPEDARAYFGKLMLDLGFSSEEDFQKLSKDIRQNKNYKRAYKFGDYNLKSKLEEYVLNFFKNELKKIDSPEKLNQASEELLKDETLSKSKITDIISNREYEIKDKIYNEVVSAGEKCTSSISFSQIINELKRLGDFKNSKFLITEYEIKLENAVKDEKYKKATDFLNKSDNSNNIPGINDAISILKEISDWKDSAEYIEKAENMIKEAEEKDRLRKKKLEDEKLALEKSKKAKKKRTLIILIIVILLLVATGIFIFFKFINPEIQRSNSYEKAMELMENQQYSDAANEFSLLGDYEDSEYLSEKCTTYIKAVKAMDEEKYEEAVELFEKINGFADSDAYMQECLIYVNEQKYEEAKKYLYGNSLEKALELFNELGDYKDSAKCAQACIEKMEGSNNTSAEKSNTQNTSLNKSQQENNPKYVVSNLGNTLESINNNMGTLESISQESWGLDGGDYYLAYNYEGVSYGVQHQETLPGGVIPTIEAVAAWTSADTIVNTAYITEMGKFNDDIMCGINYNDLSAISYLDLSEVKSIYHDSAYGAYGEMTYNSKTYNLMFIFNSETDLSVQAIRVGLSGNSSGFTEAYTPATIKLNDGYLNVRSQPDGNIIGKLYNGDSINAIYDDGNWTFIKYGSSYGYVASEFLKY